MKHQRNKAKKCFDRFPGIQKLRYSSIATVMLIGSTFLTSNVSAADPGMEELKKVLQGQIELMTPELQEKVKGLSMDTKMSLMAILAMHNRYSKSVTMRQVMTEVLSDFQSILAGIMTDNPEQTADSARRLANHRIPVGGLLPYLGMENISDERLAVLDGFNTSVEGNALKLATAAEAGDMATAASLVGPISSGCVACHGVFRTQPGVSDLLR
ncbi:MAG: cytochrome c [Candidatus Thiodiazotropha sp.]|nr:cytochrome c [Candidatus Thiodiazotropha sp.]